MLVYVLSRYNFDRVFRHQVGISRLQTLSSEVQTWYLENFCKWKKRVTKCSEATNPLLVFLDCGLLKKVN